MTVTSSESQAEEPEIWVRAAHWLMVGALLLGGASAVCASFIPFETLAARVRGMSASGVAPFFSQDFYSAMQLRLRLIGGVNIAAAVLAFLARRRMIETGFRIARDFSQLKRDIRSFVRSMPLTDWISLVFLVFLAGALRRSFLFEPMRYDEAYTFLEYSSRPFYAALSFYNAPNNHLFHTLLVRIAYLAFGNEPWALRIPVFVVGIVLVPASYFATRTLYCEGGMLAAGLVASSSTLIEYSTNARGYVIVCLAVVLLITIAAYAARNNNSAAWALAGIISAIGFYTIPIMLYPFGGIVAWLLLSALMGDVRPNARALITGLSFAIGIAAFTTFELYSPVLAVSGPSAVFSNKWVVASPFAVFVRGLGPSLLLTWREWNRDLLSLISWALFAGFLMSLLGYRLCSRFRVPLTLGMAAWVIPLIFVQRVVPFERVWLFALPLYFMAAAAGLGVVAQPLFKRLHLRNGMTLLALAISLYAGVRVERSRSIALLNHGRGLEAMTSFLKGQLKPGDSVVVALPSDYPLRYYFQRQGVPSSYLSAGGPISEKPGFVFLVINGVTGDSVQTVLEQANLPLQMAQSAKLMNQFDSASLYEIAPIAAR